MFAKQIISVPAEKGKTMDERDVNVILLLADHGIKISEAARAGYMHRNTVLYHIKNIKKETGLDPTNFYDLCKLVEMVKRER